jgi:hypothetical protein
MRGPDSHRPAFLASNRRTVVSEEIVFSDSDHDDGSVADREEEEQEQTLSRLHGEAAEGSSSTTSKKRSTAEDTPDATAKKRRSQPKLVETDLTGPHGLQRIPIEFPHRVQYAGTRPSRTSSAAYMRDLVQAYRDVMTTWQPQLDWRTVAHECEQLGSKGVVKQYVQQLRDTHRQTYLESLYDKETVEGWMRQLAQETEYRQQQQQTSFQDASPQSDIHAPHLAVINHDLVTPVPTGANMPIRPPFSGLSPPMHHTATVGTAEITTTAATTPTVLPHPPGAAVLHPLFVTPPIAAAAPTSNHRSKRRARMVMDEEDDMALEDEDDILLATMELQHARRRHILDDDDDDSDDEGPPVVDDSVGNIMLATDMAHSHDTRQNVQKETTTVSKSATQEPLAAFDASIVTANVPETPATNSPIVLISDPTSTEEPIALTVHPTDPGETLNTGSSITTTTTMNVAHEALNHE